ncbi:hypothetical protein PWG15_24665 (plasmid) [Ensifer adhaerens]|uniref:hypothetical protein n=1 Tax=Ensifer adhaerens TaxID=106592 RepID=UPI0023AA048F|nr:hypothetical protein [Ensifer adhaerens]WDZ80948.1 hypothetical protein PWG15_24665 [Ensifer adhaerens]
MADDSTTVRRRQIAERMGVLAQLVRTKGRIQAILHANLIPKYDGHLGSAGRKWLAQNWGAFGSKPAVAMGYLDIDALPSVFVLNAKEVVLFERASTAFREVTGGQFPDAMDDLAEAGRCLAFNRNTAAVFHLMRAMEFILRKVVAEAGGDILNKV